MSSRIEKPRLNQDPNRDYFTDHFHPGVDLYRNINYFHVTPESHPRVIDLFAGNGGVSQALELYDFRNIVCIDRCLPNPRRTRFAKWEYYDLYQLNTDLLTHSPDLPVHLQGQFDFLVAYFAFFYDSPQGREADVEKAHIFNYAKFFLKDGHGFIISRYYKGLV